MKITGGTGAFAEAAGTGICSGEGGALPEEQAANSRYLFELASGHFGWSRDQLARVQALQRRGLEWVAVDDDEYLTLGCNVPGHAIQGPSCPPPISMRSVVVAPSRLPPCRRRSSALTRACSSRTPNGLVI